MPGSGLHRTVLTRLKMALLMPMPSATDSIAVAAKAGFLSSARAAKRRSWMRVSTVRSPIWAESPCPKPGRTRGEQTKASMSSARERRAAPAHDVPTKGLTLPAAARLQDLDLEPIAGDLLDARQRAIAVLRAERQCLQDQQI